MTSKVRTQNINKIFRNEAEKIVEAREKCIQIHGTDIHAAGNELEETVREFFNRMLPNRFHVTHGHLIDKNNVVSPQIDMIISDNTTIPSLMTLRNSTVYIPIDSVYAIAEIKSTYYGSRKKPEEDPIIKFSNTLKYIREKMTRPLVENTAYEMFAEGKGWKKDTLIRDMILGKPHKYLNPLFSFMLFVNSGKAKIEDIESIFSKTADENLPCMTVLLNYALVAYGKEVEEKKGIGFSKYPFLNQSMGYTWRIFPLLGKSDSESTEGKHLCAIYYYLLNHLNESFLEPPDLRPYIADMMMGRKSKMIEIRKDSKNDKKGNKF
jgi:hypothetical protein